MATNYFYSEGDKSYISNTLQTPKEGALLTSFTTPVAKPSNDTTLSLGETTNTDIKDKKEASSTPILNVCQQHRYNWIYF